MKGEARKSEAYLDIHICLWYFICSYIGRMRLKYWRRWLLDWEIQVQWGHKNISSIESLKVDSAFHVGLMWCINMLAYVKTVAKLWGAPYKVGRTKKWVGRLFFQSKKKWDETNTKKRSVQLRCNQNFWQVYNLFFRFFFSTFDYGFVLSPYDNFLIRMCSLYFQWSEVYDMLIGFHPVSIQACLWVKIIFLMIFFCHTTLAPLNAVIVTHQRLEDNCCGQGSNRHQLGTVTSHFFAIYFFGNDNKSKNRQHARMSINYTCFKHVTFIRIKQA